MAVHQFKAFKKRRGGKRRVGRLARKSRVPRGVRGMNDHGQMARIKETVSYIDVVPNTGYNFNFNLSQYRRAMQLAPNFKFYKPTKVTWTIEPLYNTFQDGNAGTEITVPYLYMTMNRTQDTTGLSLEDIQAMGAKPQKLINKKVISYRPNWCVPGLTTYANGTFNTPTGTANAIIRQTHLGMKAVYDWVPSPVQVPANPSDANEPNYIVPALPFNTGQDGMNAVNANQVIYNGHTIWIEQLGSTQRCARVVATVHWSFKGPHCTYLEEGYTNITPSS
ncbi:Cap [Chicken proventriculitis-associated circular virus 23]|nr:Cap [Chicken proventriculitis-associated circular virus 23]